MLDRVTEPLARVVAGLLPGVDYLAWYRARVVRQTLSPTTGKMTVDVTPDDARIPPLSGVPLRLGLPAVEVQASPNAYVLVGWANGDPAKPQAALWDGGESDAIKMVFNAAQLFLGGEAGAEPPTKGITYRTAEDAFLSAIVVAVSAALTASGAGAAIPALTAAQAAFNGGAPAYLAARARVL